MESEHVCVSSFQCTPGGGECCYNHRASLCTEPLPPDRPGGAVSGCGRSQFAALPASPPARPCHSGQFLIPLLSSIYLSQTCSRLTAAYVCGDDATYQSMRPIPNAKHEMGC